MLVGEGAAIGGVGELSTDLTLGLVALPEEEAEGEAVTGGCYVAREGETGKTIFFIIEGSVEIISREQKKSWGTMGEGEYFGFMSLLLGERRTATTVARGFCDLLILGSDDFNRIRADFPEFHDVLKQAAAERTEKLSELILEGVVL